MKEKTLTINDILKFVDNNTLSEYFITLITDGTVIKLDISLLISLPLPKAIDVANAIFQCPDIILTGLTPEIRDIMDLANRFKNSNVCSWRINPPCQNYKCEFFKPNKDDPDNNCMFEYLQENCIDYKN